MKYDIEALKRKMLVKYPFFGSVVANVEYKEDEMIQSAGTDGEVIYYNPKFLESLTIEEQTFIFAHEVCHIAFNHILRSEGKNQKIWNIATDAVINAFLKKDGLKIVKRGVDIADAINYDSEQLYFKLLKEKEFQTKQNEKENSNSQSQQSQNSQGNGSFNEELKNENEQNNEQSLENSYEHQNSNSESQQSQNSQDNESFNEEQTNQSEQEENETDVGHDTHSMWEEAIKKLKEKQNNVDNKEATVDELSNKDKTETEKKQEECEILGEKEAFQKNKEEKKKQLEELRKELAKQVSQAGSSTNSNLIKISDIGRSKPLIDWRYILKEAIKYDVDWSYRNAYIENGVISANLEEQAFPETEIVLDTSGSINKTLLKNFLRECKNILKQSKLKVGCFDTKFYGFHEVKTERDIEDMEFVGGGGTDFNVAVNSFSGRVENKIIFTDGESSMPQIPIDAIWIVFGGASINPIGGKVINITDEQLKILCFLETDYPNKVRSK